MGVNGLAGRIGKVELEAARRLPEEQPPFPVVVGGWPAWERLFATMAPEHVRMVRDHFEQLAAYDRGAFLDYPNGNSAVRAAIAIMFSHLKHGAPLALPPAVAEICLSDPSVELHYSHDECAACGYPLPLRLPQQYGNRPVEPAVHYFERCPLCSDPVVRWPQTDRTRGRPPWRT